MLAVHALWDDRPGGTLLVWAEDGERPAIGAPRRGRPPRHPRPRPHPFAAPVADLVERLVGTGSALLAAAARTGTAREVVLWLPGEADTPESSPHLLRFPDAQAGAAPPGARSVRRAQPTLHAFGVPALSLGADAAIDVLLSLAGSEAGHHGVGATVTHLASVAGLALEAVSSGRILPDLRRDPSGRAVARWVPSDQGYAGRLGELAATLPPLGRALVHDAATLATGAVEGQPPEAVVRAAFEALTDAAARQAMATAPRSALPWAPRRGRARTSSVETWLSALASADGVVSADGGDLAKLERLVEEWRQSAAGRGGPWRLCFRLREPPPEAGADPVAAGDDAATGPTPARPTELADGRRWRLDLVLQAADDLSLMVEADEVWQSGAQLERAARTVEAPQEQLLAELGRAVRVFPDLAAALRETAPTGLDLELDGAHRFLSEAAPTLELAGFGVLLPAWWRRTSAQLGLRLRASSSTPTPQGEAGRGLLGREGLCEFDWEAAIGDETLSLAELRRLARLKQPLVQVRGAWVELGGDAVDELLGFLERQGSGADDRTMSVGQVLQMAAGVSPPVAGLTVVGVAADGWLGQLVRGEVVDALDVRGTPPGFEGQLRPYQERGVAWLEFLGRLGLGACLADDMGLGKTATVLAALQAERPPARRRRTKGAATGAPGTRPIPPAETPGPTLVVCPTSVVGNWEREAQRFTPSLRVYVHHGADRPRKAEFADAVASADLVITSYGLVLRDQAMLGGVAWGRLVLDEAQNVKNPEAKQTRAVRSLKAPVRVALTGTPVENHLGELWSIMELLNPGLMGSLQGFRKEFAIPIERYRDEAKAERLRLLTGPFLLRRLKTDRSVIADLPDKFEMNVVCALTREQATLYQAVVDEMLVRIDETSGIERKGLVLAAMLRLKQVCNHPAHYLADGSTLRGRSGKLERTVEILDEVLQSGERALVFTQYTEMGLLLQGHLQERLGQRVSFLHGGVARRRRDAMVAEFQGDDTDSPLMILSLKAGGTGLNLTAANHVVHYDRWWNPAVENQATDRAFRIGQRRDVQVRKLVCAGTLEERIDALIASKRELAERVVGTGEGWLTELSTDQLADVLRLSADVTVAA